MIFISMAFQAIDLNMAEREGLIRGVAAHPCGAAYGGPARLSPLVEPTILISRVQIH
jgi:hypothetical protein